VKARREAVEIIRRFVRGEIEEEPLLGVVRRLDLHSVRQLSETLELKSADFRRIGFAAGDLIRVLDAFLAGRLPLDALRSRVRWTAQIFSAAEYRTASVYRAELAEALSLLSLLLDPDAPLTPRRVAAHLTPVFLALVRGRPPPFRSVIRRILSDLPEFHFTALTPLERCRRFQSACAPWVDLALCYGPPASRGPCFTEGYGSGLAPAWFIPLAVATQRFYREELPRRVGRDRSDRSWMHPENCRIPGLVERHPWLAIDRFRPLYFVDPRGFAEVVLDVPRLTRETLAFAIRAFALENRAAAASLDGEAVEVYPAAKCEAG